MATQQVSETLVLHLPQEVKEEQPVGTQRKNNKILEQECSQSHYASHLRTMRKHSSLLNKDEEVVLFKELDELNERLHLLFLNTPDKIRYVLNEISRLGVKKTTCTAICYYLNENEELSKDLTLGYFAILNILKACETKKFDLDKDEGKQMFANELEDLVQRFRLEWFFFNDLFSLVKEDEEFAKWTFESPYQSFFSRKEIKDRNELFQVFNRIKKIREKLVQQNHRLVLKNAKKYFGHNALSFEEMDIVQEGYAGLIRGIDRYRYKRGNKLSTYITNWILQAIKEAMTTRGRMVRIPTAKLHSLLNEIKEGGTTKDHTEANLLSFNFSLNNPIDDDEEAGSYLDLVQDEVNLEEQFASIEQKELLLKVLKDLPLKSRDKNILFIRLGLSNMPQENLSAVSQNYGITTERVRQIEAVGRNMLLERMNSIINPKDILEDDLENEEIGKEINDENHLQGA